MGKKLRDVYYDDKSAAKFLQEHPEFDNGLIEGSRAPGHWGSKEKFGNDALQLHERDSLKSSRAHVIQEALLYFPNARIRKVLGAYYEGAKLSSLLPLLKMKNLMRASEFISRAKTEVYEWGKTRPWELTDPVVFDCKDIHYKTKHRRIYLVKVFGFGKDPVWTTDDGRVLPPDVQDLIESGDFKEWGTVWI